MVSLVSIPRVHQFRNDSDGTPGLYSVLCNRPAKGLAHSRTSRLKPEVEAYLVIPSNPCLARMEHKVVHFAKSLLNSS